MLNNSNITISQVNISIVNGSYPNLNIDANGNVSLTSFGHCGDYTFTYQICEKLNPTNCDTATAIITIIDTTAPTMDSAATNATVECDGQGNTEALQAWLTSNGGASASDTCSNVTWSNSFSELSDGCGNTGTASVTFTATDDCGNATTSTATFTIQDITAPTMDSAATNATVECDGQGNTAALQAWLNSNGGLLLQILVLM